MPHISDQDVTLGPRAASRCASEVHFRCLALFRLARQSVREVCPKAEIRGTRKSEVIAFSSHTSARRQRPIALDQNLIRPFSCQKPGSEPQCRELPNFYYALLLESFSPRCQPARKNKMIRLLKTYKRQCMVTSLFIYELSCSFYATIFAFASSITAFTCFFRENSYRSRKQESKADRAILIFWGKTYTPPAPQGGKTEQKGQNASSRFRRAAGLLP